MPSFHVVEPEVAGYLGPESVIDWRTRPPTVTAVEYTFEGWLGDQILESYPVFVATRGLVDILQARSLSGYVARAAKASWSEQARLLRDNLPEVDLRWLDIVGAEKVDDFGLDSQARLVVSDRALEALVRGGMMNALVTPA
jgi:hypothetical protein